MTRAPIALLACTLLVAGCDGDPSAPARDCSGDVPDLDVEVTTTSSGVRFDWSPRCRVALLGVEADGGDRWWIGDEEENLIEPPVRYGETPDDVPGEDALALEEGESYELILWIATPEGAELAAVEEFTR